MFEMRSRIVMLLGCVAAVGLIAGCDSGGSSSSTPTGAAAAETAGTMSVFAVEGVDTVAEVEAPVLPATTGALSAISFSSRVLTRLGVERFVKGEVSDEDVARELVECSLGGTVDSGCVTAGELATITMAADHCKEGDASLEFEIDGGIQVIANDPLACDNGVDDATEVDIVFNDFRMNTEVDGRVAARINFDGSLSIIDSGVAGCVSTSGAIDADFVMDIYVAEDDVYLTFTAEGLSIVHEAVLDPCQDEFLLNGTLALKDRIDGNSLRQTFTDFEIIKQYVAGDTIISVNGVTSTPCMGDVIVVTLDPIVVTDASDCPVAGLIQVRIVDEENRVSTVQFNADGSVHIDVDVDGVVDRELASCDDLRERGACY